MTEDAKVKKIVAEADKKTKQTKAFFIFALAIVFVFFCVFAYFNFFNITEVEIILENEDIYTRDEIFESAGIKIGDNLLKINTRKIEKELEKIHPYIKEAEIIKKPFTTAQINITLDRVAMAVELADKFFLLSSSGKVLCAVEELSFSENICVIKIPYITECIQGEQIKLAAEESFNILMDIYSSFEKYEINTFLTSLDITDKFNIKAVLDDRFDVIFGSYEEIEAKTSLLKNVYKRDLWTDFSGIIDVFDAREAAVRFTESSAN